MKKRTWFEETLEKFKDDPEYLREEKVTISIEAKEEYVCIKCKEPYKPSYATETSPADYLDVSPNEYKCTDCLYGESRYECWKQHFYECIGAGVCAAEPSDLCRNSSLALKYSKPGQNIKKYEK